METLMTASVIIRSPLLEVFDYVANPNKLVEWFPLYSDVGPPEIKKKERLDKGDEFTADLSVVPTGLRRMFPFNGMPLDAMSPKIQVYVDDVIHGRRLAYRANTGWTNICDFEPSGGRTIFTVTQSLWSWPGLVSSYWLGPWQAMATDMLRKVLEGLKRRLEGRATEPEPRIFFSYRRADARYVGGRIFDALTSEFGEGTVFRDTNSLLPGSDWAHDIRKAIQQCRVVVVHIGDGWEKSFLDRAGGEDAVRDELETALSLGDRVRIIPVLTSREDHLNVQSRMKDIEKGISLLGNSGDAIKKKFTAGLQVQRLREDPDFGQDLERLMRAVWTEFRSNPKARSSPPSE